MSKKEDRQKIKEEKQASAKRKAKLNSLLVKGAALILIPLTLFVFYQGIFSGPPSLPPDLIGEADHIRGRADAENTITVYGDFQCPACLSEFEVIVRAWPRIRDDARFVFRHFPLDTHRFAFQASRYAEAASLQGRFWEMHDLLYTNQLAWSTVEDPTLFFDGYAEQLNLDMEQLRSDIERPEVRAKILSDQQGGIRAGVRGTPVMFINGNLVPNPQTPGGLIDLVNDAKAG